MVVEVVEAEGHVASPRLRIVVWDSEPVQRIKHPDRSGVGQAGDLSGGEAFTSVQPLKYGFAAQAEHRRDRDDALDQRGDCPVRVCFWSSCGSDKSCYYKDLRALGRTEGLFVFAIGIRLIPGGKS